MSSAAKTTREQLLRGNRLPSWLASCVMATCALLEPKRATSAEVLEQHIGELFALYRAAQRESMMLETREQAFANTIRIATRNADEAHANEATRQLLELRDSRARLLEHAARVDALRNELRTHAILVKSGGAGKSADVERLRRTLAPLCDASGTHAETFLRIRQELADAGVIEPVHAQPPALGMTVTQSIVAGTIDPVATERPQTRQQRELLERLRNLVVNNAPLPRLTVPEAQLEMSLASIEEGLSSRAE